MRFIPPIVNTQIYTYRYMMVGLRWLSLLALLAFLVSTGEVLGKSIQGKPNKQTGGKVRSTTNAKAKHKEKVRVAHNSHKPFFYFDKTFNNSMIVLATTLMDRK